MSRQAGPSIVLSVLIVCFFAVALFQRDLPRRQLRRARSSVREPGARSTLPPVLPSTRLGRSDGAVRTRPGARPGETSSRKQALARNPRAAFTSVLPAETIEDVSSRVYGTAELADSLWRANRDALPKRDMALSTGMLLRTPTQTALRK
jgi:hypothetical protein